MIDIIPSVDPEMRRNIVWIEVELHIIEVGRKAEEKLREKFGHLDQLFKRVKLPQNKAVLVNGMEKLEKDPIVEANGEKIVQLRVKAKIFSRDRV